MKISDSSTVDFSKSAGLIPAVIQHAESGIVLMVGFMNREALDRTLSEGEVVFYSRSRNRLWKKGETSGNFLRIREIALDCDNDALLIRAIPAGPVCHTGAAACFEGQSPLPLQTLSALADVIHTRKLAMPEGSYTTKLFTAGSLRIGQKVGEEGIELALAAQYDDKGRIAEEAADLLYHLLVLLEHKGVPLGDVAAELQSRMK